MWPTATVPSGTRRYYRRTGTSTTSSLAEASPQGGLGRVGTLSAMAALYTLYSVALWAGALPAILAWGAEDPWGPPWRLVLGAVLIVGGALLVHRGGADLEQVGVQPFGIRPGPALQTEGVYGWVRNPQDVGAVLIAAGAWVATSVSDMWIVPVAAMAYFAIGYEPLEDRHLAETFDDDFAAYRATVRRWVPNRPG